jgi:hypothetical protein
MSILQLALSPMPKVLLAGVMWNAQLNRSEGQTLRQLKTLFLDTMIAD